MKKIALFGGSFDPIHKGHIQIAKQVRKTLNVDEVWFIPTHITPLKDRQLTSFLLRCKMIKAAISGQRHFKLCTVEKELKTPNYTINTVRKLKKIHPDKQFYFIIGDDQYQKLSRWKEIDSLLNLVDMVCVHRELNQIKKDPKILFIPSINQIESSTQVRQGAFYQIDKKVRKLILEHQLYIEAMMKHHLSKKRFEHSVSCAKLAQKLAKAHGVDEKKAYLCGLLHDYSKEIDKDLAKKIMENYFEEHIHYHHKVWHQWIATIQLKQQLGIYDRELLSAIMHHTTGNGQSKLAKILFIADKCEPLRPYDTKEFIEVSMRDLEAGLALVKKELEEHLKKIGDKHV